MEAAATVYRDTLKGFLNKPITIRGGVIINEAPVGVER